MPLLTSGTDQCVLHTGTWTLGGRGADALSFAPLAWQPAVATLTVPERGPALLRRTTAAVVVKLDGEPLGVAGAELRHGAHIEFNGCRIAYDAFGTGSGEVGLPTVHPPADVVTGSIGASVAPPHLEARLVHTGTSRTLALTGRRVLIGRDDACDIVVPSKVISRRHASISPVQGGYELRDESANGTVVNGVRVVGTSLLQHGDVIRMHDVELRFELDGPARPLAGLVAETTQLLDLSRLVGDATLADARRGMARSFSASLEIVRGSFAGASFQLDRAVCSIGRGERNDIRVRDDSVSMSHASLLRKDDTWYVIDLRSANGTFVDGYRIAGERELPAGSSLRVGSVEMIFRSFVEGTEVAHAKKRSGGIFRWIASVLRPPVSEAA